MGTRVVEIDVAGKADGEFSQGAFIEYSVQPGRVPRELRCYRKPSVGPS